MSSSLNEYGKSFFTPDAIASPVMHIPVTTVSHAPYRRFKSLWYFINTISMTKIARTAAAPQQSCHKMADADVVVLLCYFNHCESFGGQNHAQ